AFARNHRQVAIAGFERDLVELALGVDFVGCIGQEVLLAQRPGNEAVDLIKIIFLLGFKELAAGALGDLLHNLLAVDPGLVAAATPATASGIPAAWIATAASGIATAPAARPTAAHAAVP